MAAPKRMTDSGKWNDEWFCNLAPLDKLFWLYLCDACDHAGIWKKNSFMVRIHIGQDYQIDPEVFGDRVMVLGPEKWLLLKFVKFQYSNLECADSGGRSNLKKSVIKILETEGVLELVQGTLEPIESFKGSPRVGEGFVKGSATPKDKDKTKDKAKAKDKVKAKDYTTGSSNMAGVR